MKRPLFPALSAAIALSGCFHSLGNTPDAGQLTAATSAPPLRFAVSSAPTGDGGSGFGILAEYPDGGPRRVVVTRRTAYDNPADIQPDYFRGWGSLCSLRVYDPDGYLAAIVEMGVQTERERTWTLDPGVFTQQSPSGMFRVTFPRDIHASVAENLSGGRGWTMALRLAVPPSGRVRLKMEAK